MPKHIAIDDDTYVILKNLAKDNERTMTGQLRYMMKEFSTTIENERANKTREKIEELSKRLGELDEESEEYDEVLEEIKELQKTY